MALYSGIVDPFIYIQSKSTFLVGKGLLCSYDKRVKHLLYIRVQLEAKFHIYARPCIILHG